MNVRDAVESDTSEIADLLDTSRGSAERLVRERTVIVASTEDDLEGVLAYDVVDAAVHVTRLDGDRTAVRRLLDEPIEFADREGLPVELVLPETADSIARAVETKGFVDVGIGPRFEGGRTVRYRRETA